MNIIACQIENEKPTDRKIEWYRYYAPIKASFGSDLLLASSDSPDIAEDYDIPIHVVSDIRRLNPDALNILPQPTALPRRVNDWTYPRYVRSVLACFLAAHDLGAERLILLDSDTFVLSARLARHLGTLDRGCGSCWCERFGFAEIMCSAFCRDTYQAVIDFIHGKSWEQWTEPQPEPFEMMLPKAIPDFQIWRQFIGNRYSECEDRTVPEDADFVCQGNAGTCRWKNESD